MVALTSAPSSPDLPRLFRDIRKLAIMPRERLLEALRDVREYRNAWIKYQIVYNHRNDILAELLGYKVIPTIHFPIIVHQAKTHQSLVLAFRGAGKTTIGTITDLIGNIVRYPDVKILIASKTLQNAQDFLKEIKGKFEDCQDFREVFGDWVGHRQWDERSIEVNRKSERTKEPTIMTVGADGAVASKHYEVLYGDDLVEEENSRTEYMRTRLKNWFYGVLLPTLEPPSKEIPVSGQLRLSGTRYNPDDLYDHLQKNDCKNTTLVIPALDENDESNWPSKFTTEFLHKKRERSGTIIFNAQYQCDCEAMKGEIFQFEHFQRENKSDYPSRESCRIYMGVDLAIGEKQANDMFALVVLGLKDDHYWVLDYDEGHYRFNYQTDVILKYYKKYKPIWCAVESNAYQLAQLHNLKDREPTFRGRKIYTIKDKVTRAWKLTPHFEQGRVHVLKTHNLLIERLLTRSATVKKHWDLFDALDLAFAATHLRKTRRREKFGVL